VTKTNILNRIHQKGFTIVELLVVIAVIGVLATIVVVAYNGWKHTTLVAEVQSDLNGAAAALESSRNFSSGYPADVNTIFTHSNGVTLTGGSGDGGVTYCIDATVTADTSITYYLASETKDQGPQTGTCASKPGLQTAPTAPTALIATVISDSEIDLSWTAPTMGSSPITYTIQRATDAAFVYVVGEATQTTTTRASVSLSANTNYYYRVSASNSAGTSGWSNSASATTQLPAPSGLLATTVSTSQVNLSWTGIGSAAASYTIQIAADNTFGTILTTSSTTSTSFSSSGLPANSIRCYRVQAVTSGGAGGQYSNISCATTQTLTVLIVAGGGAGGPYGASGGGGAGGVIYTTTQIVNLGVQTMTVGGGGIGITASAGTNGSNSSAFGLVAIGGGGGSGVTAGGSSGGSGGGVGRGASSTAVFGAGTAGQGSNGGTAGYSSGQYPSSGGGGAGGKGANAASASPGTSGAGGVGVSYSISGSAVTYAGGGGGGGDYGCSRNLGPGAGGSAIGGAGGNSVNGNGFNGAANTGSGGGGATQLANCSTSGAGGNGGSGIVIVSYPTGSMTTDAANRSGEAVTFSGGNTIVTFTSTGSLNFISFP